MHEMSLVAGILKILDDEAHRHGFKAVRVVRLDVGALSHADPHALRFAFEATAPGTRAEGATLEILTTPGEAYCLDCAKPVALDRRGDPCPECGGNLLQVLSGDDLRVKELEVD